jgi:hypothetical protein
MAAVGVHHPDVLTIAAIAPEDNLTSVGTRRMLSPPKEAWSGFPFGPNTGATLLKREKAIWDPSGDQEGF